MNGLGRTLGGRFDQVSRVTGTSPAYPPKVLVWGDSYGGGDGAGDVSADVSAWWKWLQILLRQAGYVYTAVGDRWNFPIAPHNFAGDGWHGARPGYKIEEVSTGRSGDGTTGYAGILAAIDTQPDIAIMVAPGGNNFSTDSGATCATKMSALLDDCGDRSQNTIFVIIPTPKPAPSLSTNIAHWTDYIAALPGIVAASQARGTTRGSRFVYLASAEGLLDSAADHTPLGSPAFGELETRGYQKLARKVFELLTQGSTAVFPPPTGPAWPRPYDTRTAARCLFFSGGSATQKVQWVSNAFLDIGANSFFLGWQARHDEYVNELRTVIWNGLVVQSSGATHQLAILVKNDTLSVYFMSAGVRLTTMTEVQCIRLHEWQSFALTGDIDNGVVALWVDGVLVGAQRGVSPWSCLPLDYWAIGADQGDGFKSPQMRFRNLVMVTGSSVPTFGDGSNGTPIARAVEAWHTSGILPGVPTAFYPCNDASTETTTGMNTGGAGAWTSMAAEAAGVTPTPWDARTLPVVTSFPSGVVTAGNGAGSRDCPNALVGDVVVSVVNQATGADITADFEPVVTTAAKLQQTAANLTAVLGNAVLRRTV